MNADGGGRRLLTSGGSRPVWSPDGKAIAYDGGGPGECPPPALRCGHTVAVWTIRIDGSRRRLLEASSRNASWSPDSRRIAYEGGIDPYGSAHGIRVANADGRNSRWISREGSQPAWSRDGHSIAFATNRGIRVVLADGTRRRRLSSEGWAPMWEPRGGRLAYRCGRWPMSGAARPRRCASCAPTATVSTSSLEVSSSTTPGLQRVVPAWAPALVRNPRRSLRRRRRRERAEANCSQVTEDLGQQPRLVDCRPSRLQRGDASQRPGDSDGRRRRLGPEAAWTRNDNDDLQPSWAPDGKRLAFVRVVPRPSRPD